MLTAAQQACNERAVYTGNSSEATPEAVAEMDVMLCLHYYFDKVDRDDGGTGWAGSARRGKSAATVCATCAVTP
jgi:hypothetical protein